MLRIENLSLHVLDEQSKLFPTDMQYNVVVDNINL